MAARRVSRASRYERLQRYLTPSQAGTLLKGLKREATVLADLPTIDRSPDPDDNPVLAMAIASEADFLVSGDKRDLLALGSVGGTRILSARQFLDMLGVDGRS